MRGLQVEKYDIFKDAVDIVTNKSKKLKNQLKTLPTEYQESTKNIIKMIDDSIKQAVDGHFDAVNPVSYKETIYTFASIAKFIKIIYDINQTRIQ